MQALEPLSCSSLHLLFLLCLLFVLLFFLDWQIGTWYSNNTLVMNSTSLDLNASETLANKTLVVTTILVKKKSSVRVHEISLVGVPPPLSQWLYVVTSLLTGKPICDA